MPFLYRLKYSKYSILLMIKSYDQAASDNTAIRLTRHYSMLQETTDHGAIRWHTVWEGDLIINVIDCWARHSQHYSPRHHKFLPQTAKRICGCTTKREAKPVIICKPWLILHFSLPWKFSHCENWEEMIWEAGSHSSFTVKHVGIIYLNWSSPDTTFQQVLWFILSL